ncbi:response regulator [Niabella drilacis]|uniref:Response regulator receiver domain-containing protein n=1 Tax=Niabella drilacis (strain DSM 25811 / CCM 8410 / CCUG 62505 / LMG 26954 / E90) TaxID=1285928 RepID=A0A1G7A4G7_NIADE|nr:response regulator transcription factor [Niabella drilacis]SDE09692.1 Response regulator receiver domain-containing protein [Niabella drilacis]
MSIRIAILEEHPILVDALCNSIRRDPGLHITGSFLDAGSLSRGLLTETPDLLILDIQIRTLHGADYIASLKDEYPDIGILICSNMDNEAYISTLFKAGIAGYVLKTSLPLVLTDAIHKVHKGQRFIDPELPEASLKRRLRRLRSSPGRGRKQPVQEPAGIDIIHK